MAKKLRIRGVIVPSAFDTDWARSYIDRGLITPESAFRRELDAIQGEDVDIHINSPGGSVFAANEMTNAVADFRERTGKSVTVTVGALAASAASMFAVSVGGRFRMHTNSKLMFHGASAGVLGGAQAMADESDLLGKINSDVMTRLTTQYQLEPDTVAEWFAEGRMGWLNTTEAQAAGMVSEVIDTVDPAIEFDGEAVAGMGEHGLDVAAVLDVAPPADNTEEPEDNGGDTADGDQGAGAPDDTNGAAGSGDDAGDGDAAGGASSGDPAWQEGFDAGKAEAIATFPAALEGQESELRRGFDEAASTAQVTINGLNATLVTVTGERDTAQAALDTATAERDALSAKLIKLLPGLAAPPLEDMTSATWESVMESAKASGLGYNEAHAKCSTDYPQLLAEWLKVQKKPRH